MMETNKKTPAETNIFRQHLVRFCLCSIAAIIFFRIAYACGWYELGSIVLIAPPCAIVSYLLLIRAERNREERNAIMLIGFLGLVLLLVSVGLLLTRPMEELLKQTCGSFTFINICRACIEMFLLQWICNATGIFPRPPRD